MLRAINRTKSDTILAANVTWAGTSQQRRRGWLGRASVAPDEAIYLTPCEGVHTIGMRFPIDVAFLGADGRVLATQHGLKPWRISKLVFRAAGVLELSPGRLRATGAEVGDLIEFEETGGPSPE
ncbi:MAG TPA: DUF192 domain-containing protein [bacterium]|nr:DUF192 domain-containing protein [bacterium]